MQISKSKGVEDIGHMEEKVKEMGRELSNITNKEETIKAWLEVENAWIMGQLQERK